jgi:hypothetical protein
MGYLDRIRSILEEQKGRPSPDFRALLVQTNAQLVMIRERMADEQTVTVSRGEVKELLRLTDVTRLEPWSIGKEGMEWRERIAAQLRTEFEIEEAGLTARATAMRLAYDEALDGLKEGLAVDDIWTAEMARDLEEARDAPDEYLARKADDQRAPRIPDA